VDGAIPSKESMPVFSPNDWANAAVDSSKAAPIIAILLMLCSLLARLPVRARQVMRDLGYFAYWVPGGVPGVNSYGAPVPEEPRNNLRPSGKVRSRPLARCDPSLDW
jgi:hypothetical protein